MSETFTSEKTEKPDAHLAPKAVSRRSSGVMDEVLLPERQKRTEIHPVLHQTQVLAEGYGRTAGKHLDSRVSHRGPRSADQLIYLLLRSTMLRWVLIPNRFPSADDAFRGTVLELSMR